MTLFSHALHTADLVIPRSFAAQAILPYILVKDVSRVVSADGDARIGSALMSAIDDFCMTFGRPLVEGNSHSDRLVSTGHRFILSSLIFQNYYQNNYSGRALIIYFIAFVI